MGTTDPTERSDSFQPGQSFGKFYLVQVSGKGGTSRIFKALQQPISRVVALKIPSFPRSGSVLSPDEFLSEATLMARLDHPNIARIHDFGVEDGRAFICMEHVDGWSLLDLVERRHPLPASAVLAIALQVLEALLHAHGRDVLHQDLSPANVLVSRAGVAKLIDFGMSGKTAAARSGQVVGTPAVLSPEHVSGEPCTARSDLFSFGALLYFVCRGEPLFDPGPDNARLQEAFRAIERARWQPPLERLRALPASLAHLVRAALEGGDPQAMHRDMRELWAQAEGQTRPEDALRRELLQGEAAGEGDPASEQEIRAGYLRLRSEGRHREAVALLERALRRFPDNPVLRDLLATPPARAKALAATMEVGVPGEAPAFSSALETADAGPRAFPAGRRPAGSRRDPWVPILAALAVLALALAGGMLALKAREPGPAPLASASAAPSGPEALGNPPVAHVANPAAPAPGPASAPASAPSPAPAQAAARMEPRDGARPGIARVTAVSAAPGPALAPPSVRIPARASAPSGPRPPALYLAGPAGARVVVNDTLALDAPAPRGGWALPPGLVNLVVSHPSLGQPISSSLFVAADTLYVLDLEADGGFSVSRRGR